MKVLDGHTTGRLVVTSCAMSALCSICDGYPTACLSFFEADGMNVIVRSSEMVNGNSMEDSIYFLCSALLRTVDENCELITQLVVSGVSELGMLRGRDGIADDALTTLSAICNSSSEARLNCFVEMSGVVRAAAAFVKNPESAELAILATDTLTR